MLCTWVPISAQASVNLRPIRAASSPRAILVRQWSRKMGIASRRSGPVDISPPGRAIRGHSEAMDRLRSHRSNLRGRKSRSRQRPERRGRSGRPPVSPHQPPMRGQLCELSEPPFGSCSVPNEVSPGGSAERPSIPASTDPGFPAQRPEPLLDGCGERGSPRFSQPRASMCREPTVPSWKVSSIELGCGAKPSRLNGSGSRSGRLSELSSIPSRGSRSRSLKFLAKTPRSPIRLGLVP